MRKKLILAIVILLFNSLTFAQNSTLAKVGNDVISQKEFKIRFEIMPHFTDDNFNLDSVKIKILNTIIAEKLWAQYAKENGIDTTEQFKALFRPIERIFIRDALYKLTVEPKTELSADDISYIAKVANKRAITDFYLFSDSVKAYQFYADLSKNKPINKKLKVIADTLREITLGFMESEELEKEILLAKNNTIFKPFRTKAGWFVIRKRYDEIIDQTDKQNLSVPKQKVIERRAKKYGTQYLEKLFKDVNITIDEPLFNQLTKTIEEQYLNKISVDTLLKNKPVLLEESDINSIKSKLSAYLNNSFITANNFNFSLNNFLTYLMYEDFKLKNPTYEGISKKISEYIKFYAEQELIAEEGIKQNLLNSPKLQEELKMWKDNLLAQLIENRFVDTLTVTYNDILDAYNKAYQNAKIKDEVKVQEILTDNLETVEKIFSELENGTSFGVLAEKYTKRQNLKRKQGVLGYITKDMFGEIGKVAATLKPNDVYGPIKLTEGYSIIKILDRRQDSTSTEFESVKDYLKQGVFSSKSYKLLNQKTAELANKYGVEIDMNSLKNLKVSNVNMFTHRFMGFGGRIAAAPFTNSLYSWYEIYKKSKLNDL